MGDNNADKGHWSDCALHNGPAYKPEPCNCGVAPGLTPEIYGSEQPSAQSLMREALRRALSVFEGISRDVDAFYWLNENTADGASPCEQIRAALSADEAKGE